MGQNDDARKKSLKKFSQRSLCSILNPPHAPILPIPILENNHTVKRDIQHEQQACAPNSLMHVFLAIYTDSDKDNAEIDALNDPFSSKIKAINK